MARTRTPPPKPPRQPHDRLFRRTFRRRRHAIGLLRAALPPALAAQADLRTLRLENADWVSRALRDRTSDLVFSVRVRGEKVYFYVVVEHQSKVEPLMVVRMGVYVWRLYDEMLLEDPKLAKVPAIVALLVHHGKTGWTAESSFQRAVAWDDAMKDELWSYVQSYEMRVVDLHEPSPQNLDPSRLTAYGKVVLAALAAAGDEARVRRALRELGAEVDAFLREADGRDAFEALYRYLRAVYTALTGRQVVEMVESAAGPEGKEVVVTFAQEMKLEGRKEGRIEGRIEGRHDGRAEILLSQLAKRFGPVPAKARAEVQAADDATLRRWALRVLDADSVDEVLADRRSAAPTRKPARRAAARRG